MAVGASADYVEKQENVSVDDKKLLELGVLRPKENISDVCLGVELSKEQQNKIMGVLGIREKNFNDIPGKTSIIEHKVHLVDDCPIRYRPYAMHFLMLHEEISKKRFRK